MFEVVAKLLQDNPLIALFFCVSLGYLIGKFRIRSFKLGGIAGTMIVSVVLGQIGIKLDDSVRSVFFALFIYAVGFQGGPQFFRALNRRSLNQVLSAVLTCVLGLATVLIAAWVFGLDRGLAAGLAAGGLTQSAIIGTAGDAIAQLGLSTDATQQMQTNVAVGYAVTYIFGSLGPILLISWFLPMIRRWNIRREVVKLAASSREATQSSSRGSTTPCAESSLATMRSRRRAPGLGGPSATSTKSSPMRASSTSCEAARNTKPRRPMRWRPATTSPSPGRSSDSKRCPRRSGRKSYPHRGRSRSKSVETS